MNESAIVSWLMTVGSQREGRRHGWVLGPCPLAPWEHDHGIDSNPSFGVEICAGQSRVYCFACGYGATQTGLTIELAKRGGSVDVAKSCALIADAEENGNLELDPGDYESNIWADDDSHVFPDFLLEALEPAWVDANLLQYQTVHEYLEKREVSWGVARALDIRFDAFRQRIVFPVRDFAGRLRGLHGRSIDGSDPKYLVYTFDNRSNPSIWLGEHLLPEEDDEPLVFAESVFDMARMMEVYPWVVSPLKAHPSKAQLKRFDFAKKIITLFDNDKAGTKARMRMREAYPNAQIFDIIPATDGGAEPVEYLDKHLKLALNFFESVV